MWPVPFCLFVAFVYGLAIWMLNYFGCPGWVSFLSGLAATLLGVLAAAMWALSQQQKTRQTELDAQDTLARMLIGTGVNQVLRETRIILSAEEGVVPIHVETMRLETALASYHGVVAVRRPDLYLAAASVLSCARQLNHYMDLVTRYELANDERAVAMARTAKTFAESAQKYARECLTEAGFGEDEIEEPESSPGEPHFVGSYSAMTSRTL